MVNLSPHQLPHFPYCRPVTDKLVVFQGVALNELCPECDGYGHWHSKSACPETQFHAQIGCYECGDQGTLLTKDGRALLDFMDQHLRKPTIRPERPRTFCPWCGAEVKLHAHQPIAELRCDNCHLDPETARKKKAAEAEAAKG